MSHRSSRSPVPPTIREEETAEEAAEAEDLPVSESRALRRRKSMQASPGRELTTRQKAAAAKTQIERFNQLLSALSLLHDDSQMAIVYSLAIEAITNHGELKLLAEALHHRWLSDPSFPPICAKVALYFADLELEDHKCAFLALVRECRSWRGIACWQVWIAAVHGSDGRLQGPPGNAENEPRSLCQLRSLCLSVLLCFPPPRTRLQGCFFLLHVWRRC